MKKFLSFLTVLLLIPSLAFATVSTESCYGTDASLMSHKDGTDTSTTIIDSSNNTKTLTAHGNAQLSTTSPWAGTAAGLFDGVTDYIDSADNADWNLGTGDFEMDARVKFTNLPVTEVNIISHYTSGLYATNGSYLFYVLNTAGTYTLVWESYNGADTTISRTWTTPTTGTWYHLAAIRTGTTIKLFVDGTQLGADGTDSHDLTQTTTLSIGADSAGFFSLDGRIDELRITKGNPIYTGNFTPQTSAYTACSSGSKKLALLGVG